MRRLTAVIASVLAVASIASGSSGVVGRVGGVGPGGPGGPVRYALPSLSQALAPAGPSVHPERTGEAERAADFINNRQGDVDPSLAVEARLAAARAASGIPWGPPGPRSAPSRWVELGPKPYGEDPEYNDPYNGAPPTGWGAVSGRVSAIAVDPNDRSGKTVWVGTAGGGLWVTRNGGAKFKSVWDSKPTLAIGTIAFDENRTRTMYVGTGDGSAAGSAFIGGVGVYRSTDDGKTFTRTPRNVPAALITKIVARAGRVYVGSNRGLWYSKDGGNSYVDVKLPTAADGKKIGKSLLSNIVTDVAISPGSWNEVTAAVGCHRGKAAGCYGNGLYRSIDGGAAGTWTRLPTTDLAKGSRSDDPIGRISIAYARGLTQDHSVLWALVQDPGLQNGAMTHGLPRVIPSTLNGIYRSEDDGITWTLKGTAQSLAAAPGSGLVGLTALYAPGVQSAYNQWIAVSPIDQNVVLVGLEEIYQTKDNGDQPFGPATWETVGRYWDMCAYPVNVGCDAAPAGPYAGHVTTHGDQHAVAFSPDGKTLWAGNDGGVFEQTSAAGRFSGEGWIQRNDTLGTTQAYYAAMGADGTVYAGFQDNGIGKITADHRGINTFVGDGGDVAVDPTDSNKAWGEYVGGTAFKTIDGGKNWVNVAPEFAAAQFISPLEMDPTNAQHVALGGSTIVETTKGTDTVCTNEFLVTATHAGPCDWMVSYDLGTDSQKALRTATALTVAGPVVYAGFCGICGVNVRDPQSAKRIRTGIATNSKRGCTPVTGTEACWHIARAKGLPNRYITDVQVDPAKPSTVYVTEGGYSQRWMKPTSATPNIGRGHVFVSTDSGETFRDISRNLPDAAVNSIVVRPFQLFVATGTGVYSSFAPGDAWFRAGSGMPNVEILDLSLDPSGKTLVAATYGRGVWKMAIPPVCFSDVCFALSVLSPKLPQARSQSQLDASRARTAGAPLSLVSADAFGSVHAAQPMLPPLPTMIVLIVGVGALTSARFRRRQRRGFTATR